MKPQPFYNRRAWRDRARKQALYDAGYVCQRCNASLVAKGKGAHVHHRKPLSRAPSIGLEPLNLMALCRSCHDSVHHEMKRKPGCDPSGRTLDRDHPWFVETKSMTPA